MSITSTSMLLRKESTTSLWLMIFFSTASLTREQEPDQWVPSSCYTYGSLNMQSYCTWEIAWHPSCNANSYVCGRRVYKCMSLAHQTLNWKESSSKDTMVPAGIVLGIEITLTQSEKKSPCLLPTASVYSWQSSVWIQTSPLSIYKKWCARRLREHVTEIRYKEPESPDATFRLYFQLTFS